MIPRKIYLRENELKEQFMCERMVSCDASIGSCNIEYTNLSQIWHDADVILGTIDTDYRGEIMVIVKSNETVEFFIEHGMRIAQLVISPVFAGSIEIVDELDDNERGEGRFNSTGV